jgi:BASS family bile acid:Na+ symporter
MVAPVFLPVSLAMFMLGIGTTLTPVDFRRLLTTPRAVLIGLAVQMLGLPLIALALVEILALPPEAAMGLVLVALSPSGPSSSFFTHLLEGDVALAVSLNALNCVFALVTLPLFLGMALSRFMPESAKTLHPGMQSFVQLLLLIILPMTIGIWLNRRRPRQAQVVGGWLRRIALVMLAVSIVDLIVGQWTALVTQLATFGVAIFGLMIGSAALGGLTSWLGRLPGRQSKAVVIDVSVHNATQAMTLAASPLFLGLPQLALPSTVYAIFIYVIAGTCAIVHRARRSTH